MNDEAARLRATIERMVAATAVRPGDRGAAIEALAYVGELGRLALSANREPPPRTAPETTLASAS